jgi:hypothetical protein
VLHIIDVSAYQGTTVPAVDAVFVKATEGKGYVSAKFKAQYASAKSKAKHRGAYHFARPEESSYKDQVKRFLDVVQPVVGESVWLDLEASKLSQATTNAWARGWGDYMRDQAPGITSGSYLGRGYVVNNTGRDLSKHFDRWWFPQYPSAYQVMGLVAGDQAAEEEERRRVANRSSLIPGRTPVAAMTTKWPPSLTPWLPATNTTGWKLPDIWQFTDNWQGLDASVSGLTLAQLAGGGQKPTPQEEIDMIARDVKPGMDAKTEFPLKPGAFTTVVAFTDNTYTNTNVKATGPVKLRVRVLHTDGTWQAWEPTVGKAATDKTTTVETVKISDPAHAVAVTVTRMDGTGDEPLTIGAY